MSGRRSKSRGSALIEFTLVGIPMIFVLISVFEMSRAMWTYHTLAYAVREGTRFAIVKGRGCDYPNTCAVTTGDVARRIRNAGIGLDPGELQVRFITAAGESPEQSLSSWLASADRWPPANANAPGMDIGIRVVYPFRSALAMFWPGAGSVEFGVYRLPAESMEMIQF